MESSPNKRIKKVLNLMLFSLIANYFFGYSEQQLVSNDRVVRAALERSTKNFENAIGELLERKRKPLVGSSLPNSKIPQTTKENSKSNANLNQTTNSKNTNKKVVDAGVVAGLEVKVSQLEAQLKEEQEKKNRVITRTKLITDKAENDRLSTELRESIARVGTITDELEEARRGLAEARGEVDAVRGLLDDERVAMHRLTKEKEKVDKRANRAGASVRRYLNENLEQKNKIEKITANASARGRDVAFFSSQLTNARKGIAAQDAHIAAQRAQIAGQQQGLQGAQNRVNELDAEKQQLEQRIQEMTIKETTLKQTLDTAEEEKRLAKEQIEVLYEKLRNADSDKKAELERQSEKFQRSFDEHCAEIFRLRGELANLRGELAKARNQNEELQNQIKELQEELTKRTTGSGGETPSTNIQEIPAGTGEQSELDDILRLSESKTAAPVVSIEHIPSDSKHPPVTTGEVSAAAPETQALSGPAAAKQKPPQPAAGSSSRSHSLVDPKTPSDAPTSVVGKESSPAAASTPDTETAVPGKGGKDGKGKGPGKGGKDGKGKGTDTPTPDGDESAPSRAPGKGEGKGIPQAPTKGKGKGKTAQDVEKRDLSDQCSEEEKLLIEKIEKIAQSYTESKKEIAKIFEQGYGDYTNIQKLLVSYMTTTEGSSKTSFSSAIKDFLSENFKEFARKSLKEYRKDENFDRFFAKAIEIICAFDCVYSEVDPALRDQIKEKFPEITNILLDRKDKNSPSGLIDENAKEEIEKTKSLSELMNSIKQDTERNPFAEEIKNLFSGIFQLYSQNKDIENPSKDQQTTICFSAFLLKELFGKVKFRSRTDKLSKQLIDKTADKLVKASLSEEEKIKEKERLKKLLEEIYGISFKQLSKQLKLLIPSFGLFNKSLVSQELGLVDGEDGKDDEVVNIPVETQKEKAQTVETEEEKNERIIKEANLKKQKEEAEKSAQRNNKQKQEQERIEKQKIIEFEKLKKFYNKGQSYDPNDVVNQFEEVLRCFGIADLFTYFYEKRDAILSKAIEILEDKEPTVPKALKSRLKPLQTLNTRESSGTKKTPNMDQTPNINMDVIQPKYFRFFNTSKGVITEQNEISSNLGLAPLINFYKSRISLSVEQDGCKYVEDISAKAKHSLQKMEEKQKNIDFFIKYFEKLTPVASKNPNFLGLDIKEARTALPFNAPPRVLVAPDPSSDPVDPTSVGAGTAETTRFSLFSTVKAEDVKFPANSQDFKEDTPFAEIDIKEGDSIIRKAQLRAKDKSVFEQLKNNGFLQNKAVSAFIREAKPKDGLIDMIDYNVDYNITSHEDDGHNVFVVTINTVTNTVTQERT